VTLAYSVEHEDEEHLLEELSSILTSENALKGFCEDGGVDGHSDGSVHTSEGLHKLARKVEEVHTTLTKHLEKEGEQM
jgi:zinc finger-like protein